MDVWTPEIFSFSGRNGFELRTPFVNRTNSSSSGDPGMARNPFRKSVASATPRRRRRTLLGMEMLEDRRVMATFTVANGLDDGVGSLREAIALANADPTPDTINFAPSVTAVTLTSGQLTISTDMSITGSLGGAVTVQRSSAVGTPDFRIFQIETGAA